MLLKWLKLEEFKKRGIQSCPIPHPISGNSGEARDKQLFSNISLTILSSEELKNSFQKRFSYEYLLTFNTKYLQQLYDISSVILDQDIDSYFQINLDKISKYYFIKEYAPKSKRPHFHGFISFNEGEFKRMERHKKRINKNYQLQFGYAQWCRINSLEEDYQPTEQNLWSKRHIGNFEKYYKYIHKDTK